MNKKWRKIIDRLILAVFGSFSFYYIFHILSYNRASKFVYYFMLAFFVLIGGYVVILSILNYSQDSKKINRILYISTFCIGAAVIIRYLNFNNIWGININLSINYAIFLIISCAWYISFLASAFVVPQKTKLKDDAAIAITVISLFTLFYLFLTAVLHYKFSTTAYDLGIFDQVVWKYSHFKTPLDTIVGVNDLADHFEPILFLVGLLYKIIPSVYTLLFVESAIVAMGFYPIYKLADKYLKDKRSALILGIGYLLSLGIIQAIHYPVHPGTWLPTFYAFAIYFIDKKKYYLYFLFLILALCTKESAAIHIFFIGLFSLIIFKQKLAMLITMILSIVSYFLIFKILMPHFGNGAGYAHGIFGNISNNPVDFIKFVFLHPIDTIRIAFDPPVKAQTFYLTLGTVALMPLLSLGFIILVAPFFVERLLTDHPAMMTMGFHYSAPITAILFITAIFSIKKIKSREIQQIAALTVFICSFVFMFSNNFYTSPLDSYLSIKNYTVSDRERLANEIISDIPKDASVTAQDVFVTHLSHRNIIKLYEGDPPITDYVLLAKSPDYGSWPVNYDVVCKQIKDLRDNSNFIIVEENPKLILFKKIQ